MNTPSHIGSWKRRAGLRTAAACAALLAVCVAGRALAHPDITMACRVIFNFDGGKVNALGESWTFDEDYSEELLSEYDVNHDGAFDAAESAEINRSVFANLADVRYFTYVTLAGKDLAKLEPFGFQATAKNGTVTFSFGMRLPEPVDPKTVALAVQLKDPDFAVDAHLTEEVPVVLSGADGSRCHAEIVEKDADAYFAGLIKPQEISLHCVP